jgi:hypothetical protein
MVQSTTYLKIFGLTPGQGNPSIKCLEFANSCTAITSDLDKWSGVQVIVLPKRLNKLSAVFGSLTNLNKIIYLGDDPSVTGSFPPGVMIINQHYLPGQTSWDDDNQHVYLVARHGFEQSGVTPDFQDLLTYLMDHQDASMVMIEQLSQELIDPQKPTQTNLMDSIYQHLSIDSVDNILHSTMRFLTLKDLVDHHKTIKEISHRVSGP